MIQKKKRKKRDPKNSSKLYFTKDTENAIVRYNSTENSDTREFIYRSEIEKPFHKLAEIIIRRFKFEYIQQEQGYENLKEQVVGFLVMNLSKFTAEKGKAFSYFSVIAKNYCILHNDNQYKHEKRTTTLTDDNADSQIPIETMENLEAPDEHENEDMQEFYKLIIEYWEKNVVRFFKKKRDIDIANAVIELMRKAENIENFNKKALYLLIREQTDSKTSYITKVVNKMKRYIILQLKEFNLNGTVALGESKYFKF